MVVRWWVDLLLLAAIADFDMVVRRCDTVEADASGLELLVAMLERVRIGCEMWDVVVQVCTVGRASSLYPVGCKATGPTSLSMVSVPGTSDTPDYLKCGRFDDSGNNDLLYEIAVVQLLLAS